MTVGILELLLEYKADVRAVDSSNNTALHLACQRRHSSAASLLLDHIESLGSSSDNPQKAQNHRAQIINMVNKQQRTPLHLAASNGLVTVSIFLLLFILFLFFPVTRGIYWVILWFARQITRRLLQLGASVVLADSEGLTPALACAPNPAVARCLATILAAHGKSYDLYCLEDIFKLSDYLKNVWFGNASFWTLQYFNESGNSIKKNNYVEFCLGNNGETAQQSPSIQQTSEVYLNGRCGGGGGDSQHSSDSDFYWPRRLTRSHANLL